MPEKKTKRRDPVEGTLLQLGLSENEATLYALMLEHPHTTVQELQRVSPFPRTMLYYVLNQLVRIGLVSAIKETRRTAYIAESPDKLYDLLKQRERTFEAEKKNVLASIPEMKATYRQSQNRPGVRIFTGHEGYRDFLSDIADSHPKTVYSYVAHPRAKKPGVEIRKEFAEKFARLKIAKHILLPHDVALSKKDTGYRNAPKTVGTFTSDMHMYSGKVAFESVRDREMVVTVVQDQNMYTMQKNIFQVLWKQAHTPSI